MKISGIAVGITVFVVLAGSFITGCEYFPESTFALASDSRLPKWINLPPGLTRADVSIEMSYYLNPWSYPLGGFNAVFTLRDTKKRRLNKVYGKVKCDKPILIKSRSQDEGYPSYQVIIVNDVDEIVEHRRAGPIFYISDDAEIAKKIAASGCG